MCTNATWKEMHQILNSKIRMSRSTEGELSLLKLHNKQILIFYNIPVEVAIAIKVST